MLFAVFLAAQARKHDKGNVAFTVPVDFRGRREEVNSTANLTGYLRIPVQPEDTPRDVMKRIHQEIRDYGDCFNPNPSFAKILLWLPIRFLQNQINKKFDESLYTANKYLPTGGIVSLGYFKREEYSFPGFKAKGVFVIPGYVGKLNVLIHNYTDETCVVFAVPNAYNKEGQLDNLILELKSFLGS